DCILAGARGGISVTANIAPAEVHHAYAAALAGDAQRAHDIDQGISALHEALFLEANPIPVKWALYEMGLIETGIRLPLTPLAEMYRNLLRKAMQSAGIVLK
ncbi:MAG TPA: 4-hydroxy-tetrahydrodipicolinate synthase, partial [Gammaproteobacteria bacterium]|nr:4-hydroxy-tetrahydrodipicolinate synthase [Gammaproteobacteria bacterium]